MPHDLHDFGRKLELIAEHEGASPEAALKLAGSKKSLANEFKRSSGKIVMMRKLCLVAERAAEEAALCEMCPGAKIALDRLDDIYASFASTAPFSNALDRLRGIYHGSTLLAFGFAVSEYLVECTKADDERETPYRARNLRFLVQRLTKRLNDVHPPHETQLIKDAIAGATPFPELASVGDVLGDDIDACVTESLSTICSAGNPGATLEAALLDGGNATTLQENVFVRAVSSVRDVFVADRDRDRALLSERDRLFAEILEFQREKSEETFYPDANSSLRISAGFVEGYKAADAVNHTPTSTLGGLLDKAADAAAGLSSNPDEFVCPSRLSELQSAVREIPVNLLYSTDTVGGNSGSPVLNGDGLLVAINFDRQRQV